VCEVAAGNSPANGSLGAGAADSADPTRYEHPVTQHRVLIVDDHVPFRSIARQVLTADGFLVVGEVADGAEAIRACGELHPDLVLLDVQLPDIDGFAVASVLTDRIDPPAVVLVSSRSRTDYGSRIANCRARGYIAKAELSGPAVRRLLLLPGASPRAPQRRSG
jgi:CheY-like chemotaxis protein